MITPIEPLSTSILSLMYFGDVVFAVSGALTAARYRMDVLGFVLIGTITGIGGGTTRDLLLGRTVWWTQDPLELILCMTASLATFFWIADDLTRPMILRGQLYATAALLGSASYAGLHYLKVPDMAAEVTACMAAFSLRASAILFDIRMRPPGQFVRLGRKQVDPRTK